MANQSIIILHGWGLSGSRFEPLATLLVKRGYRVYIPDFPGFGTSQVPDRPLGLVDYADFLHDFLKEKSIGQTIIIGHSFGGRVALKFNNMYTKVVRALILSGTPGYSSLSKNKLRTYIVLAKIGSVIFSLPVLNLIKDRTRRFYYYLTGARDFYRADAVMGQTFKNIVAQSLVPYMQKTTVPTLLIWGAKDTIVPLSVAQRMNETISSSQLVVIPNETHALPYSQPSIFANKVMDFISEHDLN